MTRRSAAPADALTLRLRSLLGGQRGIEERRMFGGTAFLLRGRMVCGVLGDVLVLHLGREGAAAALARPHARPMDFTGRPLASMVYVDPAGYRRGLRGWVEQAVRFTRTLPAKPRYGGGHRAANARQRAAADRVRGD